MTALIKDRSVATTSTFLGENLDDRTEVSHERSGLDRSVSLVRAWMEGPQPKRIEW
jgi:hypothetical protein